MPPTLSPKFFPLEWEREPLPCPGVGGGAFPTAVTVLTDPAVKDAAPTPLPAVLSGLVLESETCEDATWLPIK